MDQGQKLKAYYERLPAYVILRVAEGFSNKDLDSLRQVTLVH